MTILSCSCCGHGLEDTPEENVAYGEVPYPYDNGYGMCKSCGGDKDSDDFKTFIGFQGQVFFESRFDVIRKALNEENQKKFDELTYDQKCHIIMKALEDGILRW